VGRGRVVVAGLAVAAAVALAIAALLRDGPGTFEPAEVAHVLRSQGLDVNEIDAVTPGGRAVLTTANAVLMPHDESFVVLVLGSDDQARDAFRQYETDTDPDTFELRAGNVLVLADGSNGETPLPADTRRRIRQAVAALQTQ
jgi:hypothetical protein